MTRLCFCLTFEKRVMEKIVHYGDIHKWVKKVILSCETQQQLNSAERLVRYFDNHSSLTELKNKDFRSFMDLSIELKGLVIFRQQELINS